jgi:cold shock CspA family protein/ribosome-associated translation inhibitor RaiA
MQLPLEIEFRNMERSDVVEADIRRHAEKLERFFDRITSCRVVFETPHQHHRQGNLYHVRIVLSVPGRELVVDREPAEHHAHEDAHVTVRDAFNAMRRQLEDYVREVRGEVKTHHLSPRGKVVRLVPDKGYGFIETPDGRTLYFHRNALLGDTFEELSHGMEVRFHEEAGDKGPQASSVRITGSHQPAVE